MDVGAVRVGVAISDPDGILATPLVTLSRDKNDLSELARIVREHEVVEVVVGLPVTLAGKEGQAAAGARAHADQ